MKYDIKTTTTFDKWFKKLRDRAAKQRINARFLFLEQGHFGDHQSLGETDGKELFELRFFLVLATASTTRCMMVRLFC